MLTRLFSRGLQLSIGSQRLELASAAELDVVLRARTGLSAARIAGHPQNCLAALQRVQECVAAALDAVADGDGAAFLQSEVIAELPDDQEWRDILAGLQRLGAEAAAYRVAALRRFDEYLATGQDLLISLRGAREPRAAQAVADDDGEPGSSRRQKLLFDTHLVLGGEPLREELVRLPKGETVAIPMHPHQSLAIMLARYRFWLVSGEPALLVDDTGHDLKIAGARAVVGRSSAADVAVDGGYRAVSRRHLLVEREADGSLNLTDLSSLGTFVPREYLGKILH